MYVVPLKTNIVEALRATFDGDYPEIDFRGLHASIEYPIEKTSYPGIWVNYEDTEELTIAGIAHREYVIGEDGLEHEVTRSRFGGVITMTCAALSSLERDRLYDEVVRTALFARMETRVSAFRDVIEQNDLIAMNIDFDKVQPGGDNAAPGTPWETDEWIYERSLSLNVIGEFVSHYDLGELVSLRKVLVRGWVQDTPEPAFTGNPPGDSLDPGRPGATPEGFLVGVPGDEDGDWL